MKFAGWMIAAALAGSLGCLPVQKAPDSKPAAPADAPKPMPAAPAKPTDGAAPPGAAKTTEEITEANAAETANKMETDMQAELKAIDKK